MSRSTLEERRRIAQLDRAALADLQLAKLNRLLAVVRANNPFYQRKLAEAPQRLESLAELSSLPFTTKDELQPPAGNEPFALNHTYTPDRYIRWHQTSGTRGRPLVVLDTAEDWAVVGRVLAVRARCSGRSRPATGRCWRFRLARSSGFGVRSTRWWPAVPW